MYRETTPRNDLNYFVTVPTFYTSDDVPFTAADPDCQEEYQELLEREDFFPDYEENGTDQLAARDPYLDDGDVEMDSGEAYNSLVWTQSISENDKAKFQHISFIKQFRLLWFLNTENQENVSHLDQIKDAELCYQCVQL